MTIFLTMWALCSLVFISLLGYWTYEDIQRGNDVPLTLENVLILIVVLVVPFAGVISLFGFFCSEHWNKNVIILKGRKK